MRPKRREANGEGDLFRARLDQIINMKHELVQLAAKIGWTWIDGVVSTIFRTLVGGPLWVKRSLRCAA
jgi:IS5 family transposase